MLMNALAIISLIPAATPTLAQTADLSNWPPRDYLVRSLAAGIEPILDSQDLQTGRFGTQPWICTDQNVLYPLAVAWATEHPENPWYHDARLLEAIGRGGEALVDDQDEKGMWIFRKKDNSTWGQIHMPWTYSRWIRAYELVREALPQAAREKWEQGLLLGFQGIAGYATGGVHNIPTHHAMALYIAGVCFDNADWRDAARRFMAKVVDKQDPAGFWSENFGPVVSYNTVYVEALGIYYTYSKDRAVLPALERASLFHANALWPDGSAVACIDERVVYHAGVAVPNVGFTWSPEGRGYVVKQMQEWSRGGERLLGAEQAAHMLQYAGTGEVKMPAAAGDKGRFVLGNDEALFQRDKPWAWAYSAYACRPPQNRWIQDRQNHVDVFHDVLGLVVGGGNTKLQPYWSTFTVGDPSLLRHTPGDENPNFTPEIALQWTADAGSLQAGEEGTALQLRYKDLYCSVEARPREDGSLALIYRAPADSGVEAHVPLMYRGSRVTLGTGEKLRLTDADVRVPPEKTGGSLLWREMMVSLPDGASLVWPARQHNPYTKDGQASLSAAKLTILLPFEEGVQEQEVVISHLPAPPFDGLAFEARDIPFTSETGTRTKRLDDLGSQFLGATKAGDSITFTLPQVKAGKYELLGEFVLAYVYGIVQVSLDGQPVGEPFDAYCEGVDDEGERVSLGVVDLSEGEHRVKVEVVGKSEQAEQHFISVKRWLLRPVAG